MDLQGDMVRVRVKGEHSRTCSAYYFTEYNGVQQKQTCPLPALFSLDFKSQHVHLCRTHATELYRTLSEFL